MFGSRTPTGNEFQQQPNTQTSLKETTLLLFGSLLQDTPIPDDWLSDLDDATDRGSIVTSACNKALGLSQHVPLEPTGIFGGLFKRDATDIVKTLRKIQGKQLNIASLEDHKVKGTIPPTLRIPMPKSMSDDKAFEEIGSIKYTEFIESLKISENLALDATLATRKHELQALVDKLATHMCFKARCDEFMTTLLGSLASVCSELFDILKPTLRNCIRYHIARWWTIHIDSANTEALSRSFKDLISKSREGAKRDRTTARNVHFDAMDADTTDPAATPATKADFQRLLAVVQSQHKTIEAQSKQLKSLGKRTPPPRARSLTPQPKATAKTKETSKKGRTGRTNKQRVPSTISSKSTTRTNSSRSRSSSPATRKPRSKASPKGPPKGGSTAVSGRNDKSSSRANRA
jgi:hypothetical protein